MSPVLLVVSLSLIIVIVTSFVFFKKINSYCEKLEKEITDNKVLAENLKQSLRQLMIDGSFLLDDGKIKPLQIQNEKKAIINGIEPSPTSLDERTADF